MNILVIGSGGREHAIIRKLKESPKTEKLWCAPGNGGIAADAECVAINAMDIDGVVDFAKKNAVDLVFVAPDDPLAAGMVDALEKESIRAFGPRANAAIIESSKVFSKNLMKKYGIPTADYAVFSDPKEVVEYVEKRGKFPVVIKADGLALGKGVIIAQNFDEAKDAVHTIMEDKVFGASGNNVVVEEFLTGPEVSVLAFTDGKTLRPMVSSKDHKRALDGEFALVRMPERINARPLPDVQIVDMRREVRRGNPSPFSAALRERLARCLDEEQQAILFLNRRGYSQTVLCRDCGYVAKCEQCDVSLTYHSEENCLKCHYCGARYKMLEACPSCGGRHIYYSGTGTQRVVGELKKLYPSARILRMDNDTTGGKEGHYRILKQFSQREADILVGTQMVAKGHDFPLVTLVGILDADMSLHFPDYRSNERTFQLVTQVAGRSGRGSEKGDVILQTYDPDNPILRFAAAYDYEGFYRHEVNMRAATMFPPFALIVRVMVSAAEEHAALGALREVYEKLQAVYMEASGDFLFFNRMHAPIKRIQGRHRYQVLMRLTTRRLLARIYEIVSGVKYKDVLVWVEENPSNLS